jgi:hypothetical protein
MKTYLCMMLVLLVVPATITACADRTLRNWHMMDDMGGGIIMWVVFILVIGVVII